ncbi:hypothetical protein Pfo_014649 [Paulownia fortunei]|nr:hypothetical protein Pfo_014649 [Paulownia fortunei]
MKSKWFLQLEVCRQGRSQGAAHEAFFSVAYRSPCAEFYCSPPSLVVVVTGKLSGQSMKSKSLIQLEVSRMMLTSLEIQLQQHGDVQLGYVPWLSN